MIIAQGHDLEQQFGANTLFKNVTFQSIQMQESA